MTDHIKKCKPSILDKGDDRIQGKKIFMNKCPQLLLFVLDLIEERAVVWNAPKIVAGILDA
jgi:hypothetical protein